MNPKSLKAYWAKRWDKSDQTGKHFILSASGVDGGSLVSDHVGSWDKSKPVFFMDMSWNELNKYAPNTVNKIEKTKLVGTTKTGVKYDVHPINNRLRHDIKQHKDSKYYAIPDRNTIPDGRLRGR